MKYHQQKIYILKLYHQVDNLCKSENKSGPSTDPSVTLELIFLHSDVLPFKRTLCLRFCRKFMSSKRRSSLSLCAFNLNNKPPCQTFSKCFENI